MTDTTQPDTDTDSGSYWDNIVPISPKWELKSQTDEKRVYEHAERFARIVLEMDGDLVTYGSLQEKRSDGWVQCAGVRSQDWENQYQDDHPNDLVFHLQASFGYDPEEFSLRDPEPVDNEDEQDGDAVEEDSGGDGVGDVDTSPESTQVTFDDVLAD